MGRTTASAGGLEGKGDRRGALVEYRAAYTLDPKNAQFKQAYERLLQPSSQPRGSNARRIFPANGRASRVERHSECGLHKGTPT